MPPSNVLSYFRANHKRNSSDPASLSPVHSLGSPSLQNGDSAAFIAAPRPGDVSPPSLPPIPRVASRYEQPKGIQPDALRDGEAKGQLLSSRESRPAGPLQPMHKFGRPNESLGLPTLNIPTEHATSAISPSHSPLVLSSISDGRSSPSFRSSTPSKSPVLGHHRSSKTRLNLLNPMALLMRRRSPQGQEYFSDSGGNRNLTVPPMANDLDPRIRGTGVHDFNAPRQPRIQSHNDLKFLGSSGGRFDDEKSPRSDMDPDDGRRLPEKEHTPVFKEHFDDDYLVSNLESEREESAETTNSKVLPPFARRLPPTVSEAVRRSHVEEKAVDEVQQAHELETVPETQPVSHLVLEVSSRDLSSKSSKSSHKARSRGPSLSDPSFQPIGLPRHMTSNASRFSFDMAGVGSSAQEKLLEEKHRSKVQARQSVASVGNESFVDDDDMYSMDDFDDDGGYEERIPGVNADAEDDGFNYDDALDEAAFEEEIPLTGVVVDDDDPTLRPGMGAFDFQLQQKSIGSPLSPSTQENGTIGTPRDVNGQPIGFAQLMESPGSHQHAKDRAEAQTPLTPESMSPESQRVSGLGLIGFSENLNGLYGQPNISPPPSQGSTGLPAQISPHIGSDEDELYFDDGMIEGPPMESNHTFDESWFDEDADNLPSNPTRIAPLSFHRLQHNNSIIAALGPSVQPFNSNITQLSEYHSALAAATAAAEAKGAFLRPSNSISSSPQRQPSPPTFVPVSDSPCDLTDGFEDDSIFDADIAAANAEALAYDADFYGQEFGLGQTTDLAHATSTRIVCREPNLTPITERSETSNRNSVASSLYLPSSAIAPGTPPTANLAQLQTMLSSPTAPDDDNMSYSALMKLRRGAFGGSSGSLRSTTTSQSPISGSPLTHHPPHSTFSPTPSTAPFVAEPLFTAATASSSLITSTSSGSGHSGSGADGSPDQDATVSPALASAATQRNKRPGLPTPALGSAPTSAAVSSESDSSPIKRQGTWTKGHRRGKSGNGNGSAGSGVGDKEFVSYRREESEDGGGVPEGWVVEKRRMSATGAEEVVGREWVGGGRI
ncbi:MAG: hypothetical protein M1814_004277 [Vezdaea aestivalis]|nr:MAG: hypothetical protein M1814_004277 [Vezdaea aestivalis]